MLRLKFSLYMIRNFQSDVLGKPISNDTSHITFGISPPHNIVHMFGSWTNAVGGQLKRHVLAGVSHFIRQYGLVEMMLSLINFLLNLFCMYYIDGSNFNRN
jgi:hypothetical protein